MSSQTQTIEITVTPDGQSTVHTRGFVGPGCREASRFVEDALGQRTGEQLTAEFHQTTQQHSEQRASG